MIVPIDKLINIGLVIAILFLTLCSKSSVTINEGISEGEYLYRLEVFKIGLENEKLQDEIQGFKNKYEKDTAIINIATPTAISNILSDRYR